MRVLTALLVLCALASFGQPVSAQEWPTRPVTMVVPFAAGGPSDVLGRVFAERLGQILGQQIVVENIGGAGGMIGTNRVAKAAPDGYQFIFGNIGTHVWSQFLYKKPAFDTLGEFAPVVLVGGSARVLITRKDFPADTLGAFISEVKTQGEKSTYGSAGPGSVSHISCVMLNATAGLRPTHVPYRGSGPAMQDLLGGRIDYMCEAGATALPYIESKSIKAIAIMGSERAALLPNLGTAREQGLPQLKLNGWNAVFFPKGTPDYIVRKLNRAANETLDSPAVRKRYADLASGVAPPEQRTPEYLGELVRSELENWRGPLKDAGISMD